jgi:hypothetical protein
LYNLYYHDIGSQGWWADRYVDQFEEMKAVEGEKTLLAKILIDIIEDIMEWRKE